LAELGGYLRIPLFPAYLDSTGFDILVAAAHPVATLLPGSTVNLVGPLGRGFELPQGARHLLLVADTPRLPTLLPLTSLGPGSGDSSQLSVALLLSANSARDLYPIQLLPPSLEVRIATGNGSIGHAGSLLDLLPDMAGWADAICIAADPEVYPSMTDVIRASSLLPWQVRGRGRFAQALKVPSMPCGVGACQACAVSTHHGPRLACTDGPVFDLLELL
jgi:dihydroorotate dehydrogenase electron transfer subunit